MGTPTTAELSARRQHAGRTSRAARAGMVIAVVAVTATVGIGTWVLGSGADAASPRPENSAPTATSVTRSEPPLSIAPPPSGEQAKKATRKSAKVKTAKKPAAAGASAR